MGNGSGGYQAEPDKMLDYAQKISALASSFGQAVDAGTEVTGANQVKVTIGNTTGNLDAAFGIICAAGGEYIQQMEQHANEALGNALKMLQMLANKLQANADAYQGNEHDVGKNLASVHDRLDQQKTKTPNLTGEDRRDKQGA